MIVLGIDPGVATIGFGVIRAERGKNTLLRYGVKMCIRDRWKVSTEYGELDITINLSKPEKDPKAIAAARNLPASNYPRCALCAENEGYAGRVNHPARQNHRIVPITINGSPWFMQYSPYVYYNEHCICLNSVHTPMKIDRACFGKLLDFVGQFPHYFVGSNADLPIVGGSILAHEMCIRDSPCGTEPLCHGLSGGGERLSAACWAGRGSG